MHPYRASAIAILPARHDSSRFPGKPLVDLDGLPMIVRVAHQVRAAERVERVVVATDDRRIQTVCEEAGVDCVMTGACASGTDRVAEAYRAVGQSFDHVLNIQGDEPLIDPRDVDALAESCARHPEAISTLCRPFDGDVADPNQVKVVFDQHGRALYFSRAPIAGAFHHVGVYGFSPALLTAFTGLSPSPLEEAERLEQLRALENGIPIQVARCVSETAAIGVDTPEDVQRVLAQLRSQQAHAS